tara:strand:- start:2 stop:583 length:582 start_codon:yes stop_codon:yes gene_type:complete
MAESETPESLWDNRYREDPAPREFSFFLNEVVNLLPISGTVVDIAGGNGQNAIWFALKGFLTTLIDISAVALNQAQAQAKQKNVVLEYMQHDLEKFHMPPERQWDVAFMQLFLDRELLKKIPDSLNTGGVFLFAHPTRTNLKKHAHPSNRFLLEVGEIYALSTELRSMRILKADEDWRASGRHEAWLVAQKIT